jgi:transposase
VGSIALPELGTEMSVFADADQGASWAGLVPVNHESGGKRQNTRTRKGNGGWMRLQASMRSPAGH